MARTAVLVGSSGMVGGCCLERLLQDPAYSRVTTLVRRSTLIRHQKTDEHVVDFDRLGSVTFDAGADVYCALGTTIKKAGSKAEFKKVDVEYPIALARRAHELGAERFIVVSSVGANQSSSNFYLRSKGEMEESIQSIPFRAIHIFRPSFLMGVRKEWRPGETMGSAFAQTFRFFLAGPLSQYRAVTADTVAAAMIASALGPAVGTNIYHYKQIRELAVAMAARRTAEAY